MPPREHLFVYGTLRREFNHPLAQWLARQAHFIGQGSVAGRLYDLGDYPGLVTAATASSRVIGDVYTLPQPAALLPRLDQYEDYDPTRPLHSLYLREEATISLVAGGSCQGWLYHINRPVDSAQLIPSGDYLRYLGSSKI